MGSHTRLGCHVNLNRSALGGHDNVLEFAASLGPGALTAEEAHIEPAAFVGAGALVTKDVEEYAVIVGNPLDPDTVPQDPAGRRRRRVSAVLSGPER